MNNLLPCLHSIYLAVDQNCSYIYDLVKSNSTNGTPNIQYSIPNILSHVHAANSLPLLTAAEATEITVGINISSFCLLPCLRTRASFKIKKKQSTFSLNTKIEAVHQINKWQRVTYTYIYNTVLKRLLGRHAYKLCTHGANELWFNQTPPTHALCFNTRSCTRNQPKLEFSVLFVCLLGV